MTAREFTDLINERIENDTGFEEYWDEFICDGFEWKSEDEFLPKLPEGVVSVSQVENRIEYGDPQHDYIVVIKVELEQVEPLFFRINGTYNSWSGTEIDWGDAYEVKAVEKTIIDYEKV
jgi:hypothetical protein